MSAFTTPVVSIGHKQNDMFAAFHISDTTPETI
jgi:hypothetical protein